ncbi:MAG: hypothetical protein ACK40G_11790 [Cytophagaceae bacterium]
MEVSDLTPDTAHPKAKQLLTEDFYWSPLEATGPFGNDDGADAFYGFREWRHTNKCTSPINFIKELFEGWGYPSFDFNELNEDVLGNYISSSPVGDRMLWGQDAAIIAVGFGQFVLEGIIDDEVKVLTKTAIKRELLPILLNSWSGDYLEIRREQLTKMLAIVDAMN